MNEWTELKTMFEVADAKAAGWEIMVQNNPEYDWEMWDGTGWANYWKFRGRPAQPKKVKVKLFGYIVDGKLAQVERGVTIPGNALQFPAGDIEGEVDA